MSEGESFLERDFLPGSRERPREEEKRLGLPDEEGREETEDP